MQSTVEAEIVLKGFQRPFAVNMGPDKRLYICDFGAGTVVTADGNIYRDLAGPHSTDWDSEGNLYICEYYGHRVQKISSEPRQIYFIEGLQGPATAYFNNEKDKLYVSEFSSNQVLIYDLEGKAIGEIKHAFKRPHQTGFDSDGFIYVADTGGHSIKKFDPSGKFMQKIGEGRLAEPVSLSIENGKIYTTEFCSDVVKCFDLEGEFHSIIMKDLLHPYGVKIKDDTLYVADSDHHCVKIAPLPLQLPEQ